ncbi:hypothetical protein [Gulosibacter chungangensis]|uniref:Uncharacterized protein n=1 Tax=Gulosibacter chungangensis TaxID=979746 RepID=A0A7J5BDA5_9MICO|nr:hypothetical protein [Gulosibacter chungangensis]KAB1643569.1 hypothetical protein F8O05_06740 [Gulosibacter chungangensis]
MTYDPNAGNQNPWGQKPGDPNNPGNAYGQNQYGQNQYGQDSYGQDSYGQQAQYGQDSYGQQGGDQYGQQNQSGSGQSGAAGEYGSYGASQSGSYGDQGYSGSGDYPQNQTVYGDSGQGYGQDASQQQSYGYGQDASQSSSGYGQSGYGQSGYGQGGYGQSGAGDYGESGAYGQSGGYNQGAGYGQRGYDQNAGYGAGGGAGAYAPAAAGPTQPKKGKGLLIGLIAGGVVALLVVVGLIWEFAGRGGAGNTYVALFEEQGIEINGEQAEGDLKGSFGGGSYVFESLGGEFSKVEVAGPELVANDIPYDITYTLLGAPSNGEGTVDRVRVDVDVPADAIMDVFFNESEASEFEGMDVQLTSDGLSMSMEQYGSTMEMTMQISAVEGWMVMEITSMTVDGVDYLEEFGAETKEQIDPCEDTDYESYVTEAQVDEEGMHFQWEVDDVATSYLAMTTCMS